MNISAYCPVCGGLKLVTIHGPKDIFSDRITITGLRLTTRDETRMTAPATDFDFPLPPGAIVEDVWCSECGIRFHPSSLDNH